MPRRLFVAMQSDKSLLRNPRERFVVKTIGMGSFLCAIDLALVDRWMGTREAVVDGGDVNEKIQRGML